MDVSLGTGYSLTCSLTGGLYAHCTEDWIDWIDRIDRIDGLDSSDRIRPI